jgi:hypothetical protein
MVDNPAGYSYDNKAIREDLLNVITNVSPRENQLVYGLPTSTAMQPIHQWLNDTLATPGANAKAEGADATFAQRTNPTRDLNYCQIISKPIMVTGSDEAANAAGYTGGRMAYEIEKALKEYANDTEYALMRGTLVCGSGTTARSLKGIKSFASTLATSQSGVSLSESILIDHLDAGWEAGVVHKEVYVGRVLKKRINSFVGNSTLFQDPSDKRIVNSIDVYETTNGPVKIFRHRYVTVSGDTNYDLVTIDPEHLAIAYYRKPKVEDLAKTGDAEKKQLIGEKTLEVRTEKAVGLIQRLL